jgi:ATP-dependent RNA helicase RhlE
MYKRKNNQNRNKNFRTGKFSSHRRNGRSPRKFQGERIDASKYIQKPAQNNPLEEYKPKNVFRDFGFCQKLQINLEQRKYSVLTPVQDQSIGPILKGRDLIGLANTGTGKTAAFLLPLIDRAYKNKQERILIIAPTRELAIQTDKEFRAFAKNMNLYSAICVGGNPIRKQIFDLRRNPNFVVGTPGRLKDLSNKKLLRFSSFRTIVLDEVDRMLDMGFINDITAILNSLPRERQTLFFSATLPEKIKGLASQFLKEAVVVQVKTRDTAANVSQDIVRVKNKLEKFDKLKDLLNKPEFTKVLIFTETKRDVEKLSVSLFKEGYKSTSIHGDKRQSQRQKSLSAFRNDQCKILVATDVAARGLDINNISHVINYTVPRTYNDYIHRIGRTGRALKFGQALTFID